MKRIISVILLVAVMCSVLAIPVDSVTYSAKRTCPLCHGYQIATVTCDNNSDTIAEAPDVTCTMHTPCVITERKQATSRFVCPNVECEAHYKAQLFDTHIENVYHTFTREHYDVCKYK